MPSGALATACRTISTACITSADRIEDPATLRQKSRSACSPAVNARVRTLPVVAAGAITWEYGSTTARRPLRDSVIAMSASAVASPQAVVNPRPASSNTSDRQNPASSTGPCGTVAPAGGHVAAFAFRHLVSAATSIRRPPTAHRTPADTT